MYSSYIHLVDKKASGTDGGASTSGDWRTRDITDEVSDDGNICTLAANQFTLEAGTYRIFASAPAFRSDKHQLRLYNITDGAMELLGTNCWNEAADTNAATHSFIFGRFTIAAQKTFEIQHQVSVSRATNGWGIANGFGDQIYTVVELWKET